MPNPEPEPESGQPLPPEKDAKLDHLPNALSAYRICRTLESNATSDQDCIYARILGYLILHAPTPLALAEVIRVIHSCGQDENNLSNLGKCFFNWYIRPFRKFKGRTPVPSDHPSRPSFDKTKLDIKALIKEAPETHTEAKKQALIRDGYKCVVTGKYDMEAYKGSLVDRRVIHAAGNPVHTELAHILPDSTYFDVSDTRTSSPKEYAASVLAVLSRFGYDVEKINGPKVHSLFKWKKTRMIISIAWSCGLKAQWEVPDEVTFTSPDPSILPYPSPQLLALHAACAKVAHLSGAGECIDEFDRDTDDLDVLATDGSSFDILTHALLRSTSSPICIGA
ncbi:hypothetical protein F5887DRAFT_879149 [Amanita rubescens]|nr:hypothetical protein F5887DRAFT_879149 [Amanita rubescens]